MKSNKGRVWIIAGVAALALFAGVYYQNNLSTKSHVSSNLTLITDAGQFKSILDTSKDKLLVIDLYADWCAPCRIIAPLLDELAVKYNDKADFYRVNVDENSAVASFFKVNAIPYVVYVRNGVVVDALTGANSSAAYENLITKNL